MAKKQRRQLKAKQRKQKIDRSPCSASSSSVSPRSRGRAVEAAASAAAQSARRHATTTTRCGTPSLAAPTLGGAEAPGPRRRLRAARSRRRPRPGRPADSFSRFASKIRSRSSSARCRARPSSSSPSGGVLGRRFRQDRAVTGQRRQRSEAGHGRHLRQRDALHGRGRQRLPGAEPDRSVVVPLFHLISVTAHTAKISIVGGSYANGAPAVTLRENKAVTLMNTADGTRYKLILKPVGTAVPAAIGDDATSQRHGNGSGTSHDADVDRRSRLAAARLA